MSNHKYHFVYKTTNLVNGKEYIGKRSTNKLEDGYLGSGKAIKDAIKKYGRENFVREIISFHNSAAEALEAERLIVNEEYVKNKKTYNLIVGGNGCKYHTHETSEKISNTLKLHICSIETKKKISLSLLALGEKHPMKNPEIAKKASIKNIGRKQSKETIEKRVKTIYNNKLQGKIRKPFSDLAKFNMSISQKGKKHSEIGKFNMSISKKGKKFSESHCKSISASVTNIHEKNRQLPRLKCPYCNMTYSPRTKNYLNKHIKNKHNIKNEDI